MRKYLPEILVIINLIIGGFMLVGYNDMNDKMDLLNKRFTCLVQGDKEVDSIDHEREQFSNNEILLPDYVHDDTLLVVNADAINKAFDDSYKSNNDAIPGDYWIDSLLRKNCRPMVSKSLMLDYQLDVLNDTIWMKDRGRLVGRFMWEDKEPIGKLLAKDNE